MSGDNLKYIVLVIALAACAARHPTFGPTVDAGNDSGMADASQQQQQPPASPWVDSWDGVHAFAVWGKYGLTDTSHPFDFSWSGGAVGTNTNMVIGAYRSSIQSGGTNDLAWFQANHPDWIVYDCDQTTPS